MSKIAKHTKTLRPPGPLEQLSTHRHALGLYTAVCSAARYRYSTVEARSGPHSNEDVTRARIFAALHHVISQHPSLAVSIIDEPLPSATFVRLEEIDLRRVVEFQETPTTVDDRNNILNEMIQTRLRSRFSNLGELPLWRLVVLLPAKPDSATQQDIDIVFFIHHGVADGVSTTNIFHQSLLDALNSQSPDNLDPAPQLIVICPKPNFLPSIESLMPLPVSYRVLVCELWRSLFPTRSSSQRKHWTGAPVAAVPSEDSKCVQTRLATRFVDARALSALLVACRAHGTSITALIEALLAHAIFDALGPGPVNTLTCSCPINLRVFMAPRYTSAMGVFVASDDHKFKRARPTNNQLKNSGTSGGSGKDAAVHAQQDDIWADAVRIKASLARTLARHDKHLNTGMLRFIGDMRAFLRPRVGKRRSHSFEVSNAGAVNGHGSGPGPWSIVQAVFTQCATVSGAAIQFSVCSVREGPLCISAGWQEGSVQDELVDRVLDGFERVISDLIKEI